MFTALFFAVAHAATHEVIGASTALAPTLGPDGVAVRVEAVVLHLGARDRGPEQTCVVDLSKPAICDLDGRALRIKKLSFPEDDAPSLLFAAPRVSLGSTWVGADAHGRISAAALGDLLAKADLREGGEWVDAVELELGMSARGYRLGGEASDRFADLPDAQALPVAAGVADAWRCAALAATDGSAPFLDARAAIPWLRVADARCRATDVEAAHDRLCGAWRDAGAAEADLAGWCPAHRSAFQRVAGAFLLGPIPTEGYATIHILRPLADTWQGEDVTCAVDVIVDIHGAVTPGAIEGCPAAFADRTRSEFWRWPAHPLLFDEQPSEVHTRILFRYEQRGNRASELTP